MDIQSDVDGRGAGAAECAGAILAGSEDGGGAFDVLECGAGGRVV